MKFLLPFCFIAALSFAQTEISFSVYIHPAALNNQHLPNWQINNLRLQRDSTTQVVTTHYPEFDTIFYLDTSDRKIPGQFIISRFKPGERFAVVPSCCASVDFIKAEAVNEYLREMNFWYSDTISRYHLFFDPVKFRFKLASANSREQYLGVLAEWSGVPRAVYMKNNTVSKYYYPSKGFYITNITEVLIAKPTGSILKPDRKNPELTESIDIADIKTIHSRMFRFFYKEKVTIEYNWKDDTVNVKLEK